MSRQSVIQILLIAATLAIAWRLLAGTGQRTQAVRRLGLLALAALGSPPARGQDEPPALNPFGPSAPTVGRRDDARPGFVELSDGSRIAGAVYLTRDARLEIFDGIGHLFFVEEPERSAELIREHARAATRS